MSLATRCTACGTVFRVVQDQLRVSSGWVRCGRCGEVFNAIESLIDMGPEGRADVRPPGRPHAPQVMETLAKVGAASPSPQPILASEPEAPLPPPGPVTTGPGAQGADATAAVGPEQPADWTAAVDEHSGQADQTLDVPGRAIGPDDHAMPEPGDSGWGDATTRQAPEGAEAGFLGGHPAVDEMPRHAAPRFMRQADRQALWRHPATRALAISTCVLLATLLVWQVHLDRHDALVAQWPALTRLSKRLCEVQGCELEPVRRLEALRVEASGLTRAEAAGTYRLALTVRNRSDTTVRAPAMDVVLSDALGRPVARRAFAPQELGLQDDALAPAAQVQVAARLRVEGPAVVGYTIELFYP